MHRADYRITRRQAAEFSRDGWPRLTGLLLVLLGLLLTHLQAVAAQPAAGLVLVVNVHREIDLGLAPYLSRVLEQAEEQSAQAVILELNTPGGRLDAVLQMRDAILGSSVRTIAFVNREAFSAGALVAIAANEIYMAPGGVMGAATPVDATGVSASEKVISAVRSTFRATAEQRGRDPRIAEAMVDPSVMVEGLVDDQQLLTLTANEAREVGYAEGIVATRQDLLAAAGLEGARVQETQPSLAERLVRFLTNGAVASLLLSLGFFLLLADLSTAGFSGVGLLGLGLLALFFWGHALAGLTGWEGLALVVLGLLLLGVEIFVIPGFGIAGVLGLLALLGGLFLSLIGRQIMTPEAMLRAGWIVGSAFLLLVAGMVLLFRYIPRSSRLGGLVLRAQVGLPDATPPARGAGDERQLPERAVAGPELPSLRGTSGVALSDLRPAGIAEIDGRRVDVVTQGEYIPAGAPIEVLADEGYRRVVRRRATGSAAEPDMGADG